MAAIQLISSARSQNQRGGPWASVNNRRDGNQQARNETRPSGYTCLVFVREFSVTVDLEDSSNFLMCIKGKHSNCCFEYEIQDGKNKTEKLFP